MFSMQKIWLWLAGIGLVVTLSVLLVMAKVETGKLEVENLTLQENQQSQKVLIDNYNKQIEIISSVNVELSKEFVNNETDLVAQQKTFNAHNLEKLLESKPKMIVKLSNKKTAEVFNGFSNFTKVFEQGETDDD